MWHCIVDSIATIAKVDTVYTAVVILALAQTKSSCEYEDLVISVTFLCVCVLVGWIMVVTYFCLPKVDYTSNEKCRGIILAFFLPLTLLFFPAYLIVDNTLPLNFALECTDLVSLNQTASNFSPTNVTTLYDYTSFYHFVRFIIIPACCFCVPIFPLIRVFLKKSSIVR